MVKSTQLENKVSKEEATSGRIFNTLVVTALTNAKKEGDVYVSTVALSKGAINQLSKNNVRLYSELRNFLEKENKTVFFLFQNGIIKNVELLEEENTYIRFTFDPKVNLFKLTPDAEKVIDVISRIEGTKRKNFQYNFIVTTSNIEEVINEIKKYIKEEIKYNQITKDKFNIIIAKGDPKSNEISEAVYNAVGRCYINIYAGKSKRDQFVEFLNYLWNTPYNDFEARKATVEFFSKLKWKVWNELKNYLPAQIRNEISKKREKDLPKERLEQIKKETLFRKRYKPLDEIISRIEEEESKNKELKGELKTLRKEIKKVLKKMKKEKKEEETKKNIETYIAANLSENWYSNFDEIAKVRGFLRKNYSEIFK